MLSGVEEKHIRAALNLPTTHPGHPAPAPKAVLQKVLDSKPAWCEVCSAIMNLKICKCVSVA